MDFLKLLDIRIIAYVLIAGGLTEGIMRVIKVESRKRWALLCSFGIAIAAAMVDGIAMKLPLMESVFRGLLAAAISNSGYDIVKSVWVNTLKGSSK